MKTQPEVAVDVISGAALDRVGVDVRAKLGDSKLNSCAQEEGLRLFCLKNTSSSYLYFLSLTRHADYSLLPTCQATG